MLNSFKNLFKKNSSKSDDLLGLWRFSYSEPVSVGFDGSTMQFEADGKLTYSIPADGGMGQMFLTWRIEGEHLVTDQPSAPQKNRTKFTLEGKDQLRLEYDGATSWYSRV